MSRSQGVGWGDGLQLKGFAKPQKEVPHPASPEVGWPQAAWSWGDAPAQGMVTLVASATVHPKCPGHLLKFSWTRCSLRYCSSDSRNFMSGMMDCSERRRVLGRTGGPCPAGHSRPGRIPEGLLPTEQGQAVPGSVLLLTWASSEARGGLGPITGVSCAPGVGREQRWRVTEASTKPAKTIHGCPKKMVQKGLDQITYILRLLGVTGR